ncbi:hypothetical protein GCM10025751_56100 [Haladaptatus pallidirubidus]|uniref:Uncharacterized protein n=1 Tax=Haladaptatus pallidirubidus TaxID=1008152 RepID=A0AAV3URB8_9EURY
MEERGTVNDGDRREQLAPGEDSHAKGVDSPAVLQRTFWV